MTTPDLAPVAAAQIVGALDAFGVDTPKPLAEALAAHHAAGAVPDADAVDIDREALTVTPGKVGDLLTRAADAHVRREAVMAIRGQLIDRLGRRVLRATRATGPDIITSLKPAWDAAADDFFEAFGRLPTDHYDDPARLVDLGANTVAAFEAARAAAGRLDALAAVRNQLVAHGVVANGDEDVERGTRFTTVATVDAAYDVTRLLNQGSDRLGNWGRLAASAPVTGLHWLGIAEHTAYIASLQPDPARQARRRSGFKVAA